MGLIYRMFVISSVHHDLPVDLDEIMDISLSIFYACS